jgi:ABC-type uncharacterized transport system involved in gliding motility auxiliary subunit
VSRIRTLTGIASVLCIAFSLNMLVWQQDSFAAAVWGALLLGLVLGAAWLALAVLGLAGSAGWEGWAAGGVNAALSSLFFLGICIVLYVFFSKWDASWDLTQEGRRDLAPQTIQVLQTMNREVEVLCLFLRLDDELVWIARDKTIRFIEECQKHTGLLKYEEIDPQIERPRLEALGLTHVSTQGTVVIKSGGRQRIITLSGGSPRLEERDFTNALINVLRDSDVHVGFLTGHEERDPGDTDPKTGGSALGNLLLGESYKIGRVAIQISAPEVPRDLDILVINNPGGDLHPVEIKAIDEYLEDGGRLLVLLEPWTNVSAALGHGEQLRPWLEERYGIRVGSDVLLSKDREKPWQLELRNDDKPFENTDEGFMQYNGSFHKEHAITNDFDQLLLLGSVRSVSAAPKIPEGVAVTELIRSTPDYWGESDVAALKDKGEAVQNTEEEKGPLSVAAAAVRQTGTIDETGQPVRSRVVVVGDADFVTNGQLMTEVQGNLNLMLNTFAWLSEREDLIAIRPTGKIDQAIVLSEGEKRAIVWVSTLLTLQLVVAAGMVVYILRRKFR